MSSMARATVAAATASILFGATVVVTRAVIGDIDPIFLAFLRFLIASLLLAPGLFFGALGQFRAADFLAVSGLGIIFFGLFPWFFNAGLALIPASRGALWLATMPLLTFALAAVLRFEGFTRRKATARNCFCCDRRWQSYAGNPKVGVKDIHQLSEGRASRQREVE